VRLFDQDQREKPAVAVISQSWNRGTESRRTGLAETQRAFDSVAAEYHRSNCENGTLCAMRQRTIDMVTTYVPQGARVLDLGCGPGTDDETLAEMGYAVTAIDWSPSMVNEARKRVAGRALPVEVHEMGIHEIERLGRGAYDAAVSNFGPLNCVPDLGAAARMIADRLRPGGVLVASVIGRVCPWEIAVHAVRGDWRRIRVRFSRNEVGVPLNGGTVWTKYYAPAEFQRLFAAAGFTRLSLRAMGLLVPPPYMDEFASRHPAAVGLLRRMEDGIGALPGVRNWGDHFLIAMRKGAPAAIPSRG
jgi:2-polyprenyl-3-methyl-5-hydroxy-6-metoxy-1,4-benzoquinol methylase